jgi:hypothetical protein
MWAGRCILVVSVDFAITFKRYKRPAPTAAQWLRQDRNRMLKSSLSAPRNAPLRTGRKPGADIALFLYHRCSHGAQRPRGERI